MKIINCEKSSYSIELPSVKLKVNEDKNKFVKFQVEMENKTNLSQLKKVNFFFKPQNS